MCLDGVTSVQCFQDKPISRGRAVHWSLNPAPAGSPTVAVATGVNDGVLVAENTVSVTRLPTISI